MEVVPISSALAREVAEREHYMHRKPMVSSAFGLYADRALVGICVYGTPASRHLQKGVHPPDPSKVTELNRLWVDDRMPKNTESWFVSRTLKALPQRVVVSYADTAQGHAGYVYRALNFHYAGWTDMERKTPRLEYESATPGVHSRDAYRNGYASVTRRTTKVRYWTTTGSPAERRTLRRAVAWPSLDWHLLPPPVEHKQVRDVAPYVNWQR